MREKIAEIVHRLRVAIETEHYDFHFDAEIDAENQLISLLCEGIEKVENPYPPDSLGGAFELCRQEILAMLKENEHETENSRPV